MGTYHDHIELDAAITTAVRDGARVEPDDNFATVCWPRLDGRYTVVNYRWSDPDYPEQKAKEIRSYSAPVRAILRDADARSATS